MEFIDFINQQLNWGPGIGDPQCPALSKGCAVLSKCFRNSLDTVSTFLTILYIYIMHKYA